MSSSESASSSSTASAASTQSASSTHAWNEYSGAPLVVRFGLGPSGKHCGEGRCVSLEFSAFHLVMVYVPNAGEGLKRIEFRIDEWEADMRAHLNWLAAGPEHGQKKPVVMGGDLNVAHRFV